MQQLPGESDVGYTARRLSALAKRRRAEPAGQASDEASPPIGAKRLRVRKEVYLATGELVDARSQSPLEDGRTRQRRCATTSVAPPPPPPPPLPHLPPSLPDDDDGLVDARRLRELQQGRVRKQRYRERKRAEAAGQESNEGSPPIGAERLRVTASCATTSAAPPPPPPPPLPHLPPSLPDDDEALSDYDDFDARSQSTLQQARIRQRRYLATAAGQQATAAYEQSPARRRARASYKASDAGRVSQLSAIVCCLHTQPHPAAPHVCICLTNLPTPPSMHLRRQGRPMSKALRGDRQEQPTTPRMHGR
jgi:hypothetical protein